VVLSTGAAACWGGNAYGQLGTGDLDPRLSPTTVPGLESGVIRVAAGRYHTGALLASSVQCWGHNSYGQLGDGTTVDKSSPVEVAGISGLAHLSMGSYHSCGVTAAGGAQCWGRNDYTQLGNGLTANSPVPVDVLSLVSAASMLAAGLSHTCALLDTGVVQCWGRNDRGQLGDGTTLDRSAPVTVICR
jgi:alpha-tubulin suppressor-like RCC1 family protein